MQLALELQAYICKRADVAVAMAHCFLHIRDMPGRNPGPETEDSCDFPQLLLANFGSVLRLGHNRTFQILSKTPYHTTLYSLSF
jgi:hypothetical protein